jgi:hypothetical protein
MAPEHGDALTASLGELRRLLAPVISTRIAAAEQAGHLVPGHASRSSGQDRLGQPAIVDWDLSALLRVMFLTWNAAFRDGFTPNDRSAVSLLRTVAERHERGASLTPAETVRAQAEVQRLLTSLGSTFELPRSDVTRPAPAMQREPAQDTSDARTPARDRPPQAAPAATDGTDRPFKIVCWLKPDEAQLVVDTYAAADDREITTAAGTIVRGRWYGPDHPDAIKYRAAVCMLRYGRSKEREPKPFWLRREEAVATLEAYRSRTSVEFMHAQHGKGGRAVFHPDDAPEAQRYFANVMLVRFR